MRVRRHVAGGPATIPLGTTIITWLPISFGIVLASLTRAATGLLGGGRWAIVAATTVICGLSVTAAASWLHATEQISNRWTALRLSLVWIALSIVFRALWLGEIIGAGWDGVLKDYRIWAGEPWTIVLCLVALGPLILTWRRRTPA